MKVDLGTCAACGAKNSKFVEACYKCGAALPWAPNYVAPKPQNSQPQTPAPQAQPAPRPASPANEAKTVVSPPIESFDAPPAAPAPRAPLSQHATRRVQTPVWALAAGVLGSLALGMLLMAVFGRPKPQPATVVIPPATPTRAPTPAPTAAPGTIPTPVAAAPTAATAPTVAPTPAPTATTIPTVAPVAAASPPLPPQDLSFEKVLANTRQGTTDQQKSYWNSVVNSKVSWRGNFVSIGSAANGPLTLRSGAGKNSALVVVNLDGSSAILPAFKPDQSIAVEGNLEGYSPTGFTLSQGKIK